MRAYRSVSSAIESALKSAGYPPLSWYDVLWELEGRPNGLRLFELEQSLLLPQYNLSRLVDRLVKQRLVKKSTDPEDARGRVLQITPRGVKLRADMWPTYAGILERSLGEQFRPDELKRLATMLRSVLD